LPAFQPKQLVPKLLPYVTDRTGALLDLFEKHADSGEAIELDDLFTDLTMDVINYYLYGRSDLNYDLVSGRKNLKVLSKHVFFFFSLGFYLIIISLNSMSTTIWV
jgi:cytochrome P450